MFPSKNEKTALVYDGRNISYSDLVNGIFSFSSRYSVSEGDRVAVFADNSPEWIYAFYSAWVHKAVAVPLDSSMSRDEFVFVLGNCLPAVIVCTHANAGFVAEAVRIVPAYNPSVLTIDDQTAGSFAREGFPEIDMDSTAVIIYTSGTTGNKKGVMLSYDNLLASIEAIAVPRMLTSDDSIISLLPFFHIFPLQGTVIAPLYLGATVVMVKNLTAGEIASAMKTSGVTMFLGVPRLYEMLHGGIMKKIKSSTAGMILFSLSSMMHSMRIGRFLFSKVHNAFGGRVHTYLTGGARMNPAIAKDLKAIGFRLVEGYGLTETSPLVAFNPFGRIKTGSVGLPMPGVEVKISDGEVAVRGRNVMKGYYNNPAATEKVVRGRWFYTGDCGYFDRDGYLYLTGRKDDMIVLPNGKNIDPGVIEKAISDISPLVKEVGIIQNQGRLVALIYPDFQEMRREKIVNITESLKYMVLDRYNRTAPDSRRVLSFSVIQHELPRTKLGKLRRFMLKDIIWEKKAKNSADEPSGEEYMLLKDFLSELKKVTVGPDDHLELDLGLDSLDRVELAAYIESAFNVSVSPEDFASHPVVSELVSFICERKKKRAASPTPVNWNGIINSGSTSLFKVYSNGLIYRLIKMIFYIPVKIYFFLKVEAPSEICGPFIITPNHQSYIDFFLLAVALPVSVLERCVFVANKKRIYNNPLLRLLLKRFNVMIIDINGDLQKAIKSMASVILSGSNIAVFPEGHRSRDGRMSQFKKSFAILSKELNVPVMPVSIDGSYRALKTGNFFPRPCRIKLTVLPPVIPSGKKYEEIIEEVMNSVKKSLGIV